MKKSQLKQIIKEVLNERMYAKLEVGTEFNDDGSTYKITKLTPTQVRAVKITKSGAGKQEIFDRDDLERSINLSSMYNKNGYTGD